ncbi:gliding motility-associated C-terminal domain-containing protein [Taibaiella lutea]|uniref:Gliding motility-associated C-terminal domain-containing protein n=1 Tax=Taibaiella lutea TaxID=2608001 RepID=A0A5M6CKG5_9BACT|nr:gliding motility-associated C-terminal domain-containing protein [Taibaiella lutea]KAA5534462.1 gliding motility-associated C-terminal domain-containing protein [Taibaiella lutea]
MKKVLQIFSAFLFLNLIAGDLKAQLLPPNLPEQDACSALQICGNFFTPYGYQSTGSVMDLNTTPCGSPEAASVWFRLEVNSPGIIVFAITPVDPADDYDFAVVDITNGNCNSIQQSEVIRCNFNNNEQPNTYYPNGVIGLNTTSTTTTVFAGLYGQPFLQQINANAGDVYLIMINNYGHDDCFGGCPGSGFLLDFAGSTAGFNQPPPPKFQQVLPYCDLSQQLTVKLNTNVLCSSIATDGSDFYLTPSGTVASAQGLNCTGPAGYTDKIKLNFSSPLPNGDYSIHAKVGTDGNTLLGLCNSALVTPDSLNFHVGLDPIAMISIDSPACQTIKINLNTPTACNTIAPDGTDFVITGPSNVVIASATGTNCIPGGFTSTVELSLAQPIAVDGIYTVKSYVGSDGNTLADSCGRVLPTLNQISFNVNSFNGLLKALPDSTICNLGEVVTLYGINNGPSPSSGFDYTWTPTTNVQNPNSLYTPLIVPGFFSNYVLATVDANGCYLRDSAKIRVIPFIGALTPLQSELCIGDALKLHASNGVQYSWYEDASLSTPPDNNTFDCTSCPEPIAKPPLGTNDYFVLIKSSVGCLDTLKTVIVVHDKPLIESYPADTTVKYGKSVTLHATGGTLYSWSPVSTMTDPQVANPIVTPKEPTAYIVVGLNEFGCMNYDTSFVDVDYRVLTQLPNAFSPNGDDLNDVFKVANIGLRKLITFQVYDRWGKQVFETINPDEGWDGTYKGKPLDGGVYYYYIKLGYADNVVETFKGDVTLIR